MNSASRFDTNASLASSTSVVVAVTNEFMRCCTCHAASVGTSRNRIANSFIMRTATGGMAARRAATSSALAISSPCGTTSFHEPDSQGFVGAYRLVHQQDAHGVCVADLPHEQRCAWASAHAARGRSWPEGIVDVSDAIRMSVDDNSR